MKLFNMYLLKRNSALSLLTSVSLATLLTACNGGSEGGSDNPVITSPVDNTAIFSANIGNNAIVGERTSINVTGYVNTSDDSEFEITSVESLSGDACQVVSSGSTSFDVSSNETQDCLYQYRVSPMSSSAQSESYVRVASASTYASTSLPRITASTTENQEIIIDLETELGASMPDSSYELQEQMVVIGNGNATYLDSKRIQFTPTGKGQSEIFYSYESDSAIKQGTISVSVSELTDNTPPTANAFAHQELIKLGESTTIDVASYVSDLDGDNIQLVSVEDFNSTIALLSPTDVTNTQFTFESTTPGAHDVAYTVSDHMGGYTTSVARIEVERDFSLIQDWEDIVTYDPVIDTDIRFFAPMSKAFVDYVNVPYEAVASHSDYPARHKIVLQSLNQARQYCKVRGGRLPLQRELEALFENESPYSDHNWPDFQKYWTADIVSETEVVTVDLSDGQIFLEPKQTELSRGSARFTTCVDLSSGVKDFSISAIEQSATGNEYVYQIEVIHPDGGVGSYQDVEVEVLNDAGVFECGSSSTSLVMDSNGSQLLSYYDTSFSDSVIAAEIGSVREFFVFVPDEETSALDTTDGTKWNHIDIRYGLTLPPIGEGGIPVLFGSPAGQGSSTVYKQSFSGNDFVMAFHIKNTGRMDRGAVSFFIQQQGNLPDQSWFNEEKDPERDQPGAPQTSDTFNIVTQFAKNEFNFYQGFDNFVGSNSADVQYEDRYLWFQKKGDFLYHYSSNTPIRPSEPDFSKPFDWGDIDPTEPYWVGVGGSTNYDDLEVFVISANFASYL